MPYDITYKRNLMNKINQKHGNMGQTDSCQRGGARG